MYASHAIKSGLYLSELMSFISISLSWSCQNRNNSQIMILISYKAVLSRSLEETNKNIGLNFQFDNTILLGISIKIKMSEE